MWRLYKKGLGLVIGFIAHLQPLTTDSLDSPQLTTESQLQLSLFPENVTESLLWTH
jgi:hypothetical protein